jgi:two-component system chemotaxis sensor kinase CheA
MDAIRATYFQECDELLIELETGLLALESGDAEPEVVNAVFRAVHSIKGGAGAFGYDDLVAFSHVFETTLDEVRSGRLAPTPELTRTMLRAADILTDLVAAARAGVPSGGARADDIARDLARFVDMEDDAGNAPPPPSDGDAWGFAPVPFTFEADAPDDTASQPWRLAMRPSAMMYARGNDAYLFLRALRELGATDIVLDETALPVLSQLPADESFLSWTVMLPATVAEADIRDIFDFVGEDCAVALERAATSGPAEASALPRLVPIELPDLALPDATQALSLAEIQALAGGGPAIAADPAPAPVEASPKPDIHAPTGAAAPTIRVDLDRVDRLINLVGELVINQAMLAQRVEESGAAGSSAVAVGLDELEQLTREIQDSVMAIRAQPVRSVFQRMPRLVREISASTGKQVKLVTEGEATEVDKTVIERLSDPITHMLRNAIDHGLEAPEQRLASGKAAEGTVRLAAFHRSGRIIIEVSDDGRGIDRARVKEIAAKKGLIPADSLLSDDETDNLIFLPGFSTASVVSNISGRGVGMDVVRRSVQALGGRISISSRPGLGSTFTLSLPLTLAVLDGMVVVAGEQTLVAPITAIIESLRPKPGEVRRLGPKGAVLSVRGAHVPLLDIGVALGFRTQPIDPTEGVVLLVETEGGGRAAIVVDSIVGQRQVVIKSLEANFQRVEGVAAATILGDGRVALILDLDALIQLHGSAVSLPMAKAS